MAAVKSHQAEAFLKAANPSISAILVYGSDAGLVSERARRAAALWAALEAPPGDIVRLDDEDLDGDPDKLAVEVMTVAMFGGRKVIRATAGRRINAVMLKAIVEVAPLPATLIVEAQNLKSGEALRTLFEKSPHAVAIPCYADEERDLGAVIDADVRAAGLSIGPDARAALIARLGADRALSRGEIEKLVLYCHQRKRIGLEDVEAIVGDASETTFDRVVDAAAGGDAKAASVELHRVVGSGESAQGVILALQRHFLRLDRLVAETENGRSIADCIKSMRPPVHFKQKDALEAQARRWRPARLGEALSAIATAAKAARRNSALEHEIAERLVLSLALMPR
ncbi:MAG: DNA polymerase III subunit delta [Hyphomicrobiaceae bacterium]|nr:DNA polymerase III subunit delta [Hyphomicrobiaceae bacterium]